MCVSVMYSGGNNVCGTTASVHIHLHGELEGRKFDFHAPSGILFSLRGVNISSE